MTNLKLTQLSTTEFRLDSPEDFCLHADGNCMTLLGNSNEVTVLELMAVCDTMILLPYKNRQIVISQSKPISEVIRDIDFVRIYSKGTVQESQELALDLIYSTECAIEPLKARTLQADINNHTNICCVLTTYGKCEIYKKIPITEEWKPLDTNISNILLTDIYPTKQLTSKIKTLTDFKNFADKYIITCFVMSQHPITSDLIIYLGTAGGFVVALKYNETSFKFEKYCHVKTSLNHITYITTYKHFLLAGCNQGKVLLLKIDYDNANIKELDYLWSNSDRMSCRKAIFTYNEDLRSYMVVFSKAAHFCAHRLDEEGTIVASANLRVNGIRISGIESINGNQFIITTITCTVKHITISCPTEKELQIKEQVIEHDFDSLNYQILGVAASASKNLWSFVLYRNKDYLHQSKYSPTTAFLYVCKLNNLDSFENLINLNLKNMDMAHDILMAINLDIFNNMDVEKYMAYFNLEQLTIPPNISDAFVQKLQIKMILTRILASYQTLKYKKLKAQTNNEFQILEAVLLMLHILRRLSYLKDFKSKENKFSNFQELSIRCMQSHFNYVLNDIVTNISNEEDGVFHKMDNRFVKFFKNEFEKCRIDMSTFEQDVEICMTCNHAITDFMKCDQDYEIKRCSISSTQLVFFKTIHCPHCYALARNDDDANLRELFDTDDEIKCIYCGFLLKQDEC